MCIKPICVAGLRCTELGPQHHIPHVIPHALRVDDVAQACLQRSKTLIQTDLEADGPTATLLAGSQL